jgi:arylsulfatase A-like enzyme
MPNPEGIGDSRRVEQASVHILAAHQRRSGMMRLRFARVLLLIALLPCAACTRSQPPPNVIVILIDALRADHLGCYGYQRPTSPNIDALAAESSVFDDAIAQSSWTGPSVASLFTSTYPSVHGMVTFTAVLPSSVDTLAEALRRGGYETAAFSANFVHVTAHKGFDQGFDRFVELKRKPHQGEEAEFLGLTAADAGEVTDRAVDWLAARPRLPFFLYLHYMDPHSSYHPPPPYRGRFAHPYTGPINGSTEQVNEIERGELAIDQAGISHLVDLYDGEIAFADSQIGRLIQELRARALLDSSIVVLLADHGEEFHEHGGFFHGYTLYDEMIRVPLMIRLPHARDGGKRVESVVQLIDVGPTILDLVNRPDRRATQGRSFASLLAPGASRFSEREAYSELFDDPSVDTKIHPKKHKAAITTRQWSYLVGRQGGAELYDLASDGGEQNDRAAAEPERVTAFQRDLQAQQRLLASVQRPKASATVPLNEAEKERLRALGYVN